MLAVLDELLWSLRRDGLAISTSQALDAARVARLVGFDDRSALRRSLGAVLVTRAADREPYRQGFDRFFAPERARAGDLWGRLRDRGFADAELEALRELLQAAARASGGEGTALSVLAGTDGELDALLRTAGIARALAAMTSPLQVGFFTQRLGERLAIPVAASALSRIGSALREGLGTARGDALAAALREELEAMRRRVRAHVDETLRRRTAEPDRAARPRLADVPFVALSEREIEDVRRAVRTFAARLRGRARVRLRHARRGRIDARRTLRASLATGGVAFVPARRAPRRDRPTLWVLCDVSDSVRTASRFLLELTAAVQELFSATRSFVFVSELGEITDLVAGAPIRRALARIASGGVVSLAANSNYGRVLTTFEERFGKSIDRRATVVILGDGRTNYHPHEAATVRRLRDRARSVLWICPEGRSGWGTGDSAMLTYEAAATKVLVARTARELEDAARRVVAAR